MDFALITLIIGGITIGIVIGIGISLYIRHKQYAVPQEEEKDIWKRIEEITKELAEVEAKKKAVKKSFKAGTIAESLFVTKSSHYDVVKEQLEHELEALIKRIASPYLEEEMAKRDKRLRELSDIAILTKKIKEMEQSKKRLENEKEGMHIQMRNMEEEVKNYLAEKNRIENNYKELIKKHKILEKEVEALRDRIATEPVIEDKIKNLENENRILRKALEKAKSKALLLSKQIAVMDIIINRHMNVLEKLEEKTADDIVKAVNPKSAEIREMIRAYNTPQKAYYFVRDSIAEVPTSFNYWLSVDEVLRIRAGDLQDKAIVLCSMLRALGKDAKVIVVELRNGMERALVFSDNHLLDFNRDYDEIVGTQDECLKNYSFDKSRIKRVLYQFNDKVFEGGT